MPDRIITISEEIKMLRTEINETIDKLEKIVDLVDSKWLNEKSNDRIKVVIGKQKVKLWEIKNEIAALTEEVSDSYQQQQEVARN